MNWNCRVVARPLNGVALARSRPQFTDCQSVRNGAKIVRWWVSVLRLLVLVVVGAITGESGSGSDVFVPGDYQKLIIAGDPGGVPADSPANRIDPNTTTSPWAGVGSVDLFLPGTGTFICTGTPITNRHIMTAGHCLDNDDNGSVDFVPANVTFHLNYGSNFSHSIAATGLTNHPNYTGFNNPNVHDDVAIITLGSELPAGVPIYPLQRNNVGGGTTFTMVGYGTTGDGVAGFIPFSASFITKRCGRQQCRPIDSGRRRGGAE